MRCTVLLLLGLLAACDVDSFPGPERKAKDAPVVEDAKVFRAQLEIQRLQSEVMQHQTMRGEWPRSWRDIKRSGRDPWGEEYVLEIVDEKPVVSSSGPDRELGTDDDVSGS